MSKRTKRISKALDYALVRACESYGREDGPDADELRSMFDLWWRFGLVTGKNSGISMVFDRSFDFNQFA